MRRIIKHMSGIKFTITIYGDPLSPEDEQFIKTFNDPIYFNERECYHWMFDQRMPSGRFLENITLTNALRNAKAKVFAKENEKDGK